MEDKQTVADVMTDDVPVLSQDTSIETAARVMVNKHIAGAPVLSRTGQPVGVVSMMDLLEATGSRGHRASYPLFYRVADDDSEDLGDAAVVSDGQIADVMSPFVLSIEATATLNEAARRMISEQVHRLLVLDGTRLVGVVTALDLLRAYVTSTA
jgi:CBS domain-containing protein